MIAIVDYGVGNLFSLKCSFAAIGADAVVTGDPAVLHRAERILLPGVGAFGDAADKLRESGLDAVVIDEARAGKPLLGICVGMQLLFERDFEYGEHKGLGLIPGDVRHIGERIPAALKISHIGWNALHLTDAACPLFRYTREGDCVYFVHSYAGVNCEASTAATVEYGAELTAAVRRENIFGTQFHPEKSGRVGLNILRAFTEWEGTTC